MGIATEELANDLNTLSGLYIKEKNFSEAFKKLRESIRINKKINNTMGLASNYKLLGDFFKLYKNKLKARNSYQKSIGLLKSLKSDDEIIIKRLDILNQLIKRIS